jgi:hypothetical protein
MRGWQGLHLLSKPPLGARVDPAHPLAQGLVSCALFNEGSGPIAFDIAAANQWTQSSTGSTWAGGPGPGGGVKLDGAAGCWTSSFSILPNNTDLWTVVAWATPASTSSGNHNLFATGVPSPGGYAIQLRRTGADWNVQQHNGPTDDGADASNSVTAGKRQCVAGTWDGSKLNLYVDGLLIAQGNATVRARSGTTNAIGCDFSDPSAPIQLWDGTIERVDVWRNRALNAAQIAAVYNDPHQYLMTANARRWFGLQFGVIRRRIPLRAPREPRPAYVW